MLKKNGFNLLFVKQVSKKNLCLVFLAWVGPVTGNDNIFLVGLISSVTNIPRIDLSLNSETIGPQ